MKRSVSTPDVLLTGGNPQAAKADGDRAVRAYIAAIPSWKRDLARRLDELVTSAVPGVHKRVRWIDIHEDDLGESLLITWVKRAAAIPGWGKS